MSFSYFSFLFQNVIFVDGHFSHVSNLLLVQHCQEYFVESGKRVEVFCLPSGQTNQLQPFDVSVFGGVKKKWRGYLRAMHLVKGGMVCIDYNEFLLIISNLLLNFVDHER